MPMVSPCFMVCRWWVASPTFLTVTDTLSPVVFMMLRGISSMVGIQSMRNCPGLALAHCLSVNV